MRNYLRVSTGPAKTGASTVYKKTIVVGDGTGGTYTKAQLNSGIELFTPEIGTLILDISVYTPSSWGAGPVNADIGNFVTEDSGILNKFMEHVFDVTANPVVCDSIANPGGWPADVDASAGYYGYPGFFVVNDDIPLKLIVNSNGTKTGTVVNTIPDGSILEIYFLLAIPDQIIEI